MKFSSKTISLSHIDIESPQQGREETKVAREAVEVSGAEKTGKDGCVGRSYGSHTTSTPETKAPVKRRAKTQGLVKKRAKKKTE